MRWLIPTVATLMLLAGTASAGQVSFRNEVMAVLSKAGCNLGVCHGNRSGKGGFKLSLRGEDAAHDHEVLTRALGGRRIDRVAPEQSLALKKPSMQLAHEGGRRFREGDAQYEILRDWIAAGAADDADSAPPLEQLEVSPRERIVVAPEDAVQLRVTAHFAGRPPRDVTSLAVYETANRVASVSADGLVHRETFGETTVLVRFLRLQVPVRLAFVPARPDFAPQPVPEHNYIDRHVFAKLRALRMNPSPLCSDSVFVRRLYLDLLGVLPTAEEARWFVADDRPDKRARLIDALLVREEFADHWALKWSDLLRNEEKVLDRKGVQNFYHWIRRSIADGKPLDQFARELVAARGSTYSRPEANWYRANRDAVTRAEATARVFLGTRLQCAKCHNHPFDRWTQDDYYGWAAVFARVRYKILENNRRDRNDEHEFDGEQVVWVDRSGELDDPRTGAAAAPRLLGEATPAWDAEDDRLEALAAWIASPDNHRFARAQANRIWFHLLGRGLVDPVDDFRATNPPSHPELLDALATDLVEHGFNLRHLVRTIAASRVYQLAAAPNEMNRDDELNYSHAYVRRLAAEPLLDAFCQVLDTPAEFNGYPRGVRAGQLPGVRAVRLRDGEPSEGDQFLKLFGKPPRLLTCECERRDATTLGQAFNLVSGPLLNRLLTRRDNRLGALLGAGRPSGEMLEELYWAALSRGPRPAEKAALVAYLDGADDRRAALEDVAWGLLNAKEFLFRP